MGKCHLFAIGNSEYDEISKFPKIPYARNDASGVFDVLVKAKTSIINENTSTIVLNSSLKNLRQKLSSFFSKLEKGDMVVFYFAGHGKKVGRNRLFLVMTDSKSGNLASTGFNIESLIPFFEEIGISRYLIILDCCYSGIAVKAIGYSGRNTKSPDEINLDFIGGYGKVVIASSSEYGIAHELPELKHGLFTYYFINAIKYGIQDNFKKTLSIHDIFHFVGSAIRKNHEGFSQEPRSFGEFSNELIISKNILFKESLSPTFYLPELIKIPQGEICFGDQVPKKVISSFELGVFPITVKEWRYYCESTRKRMPKEPEWGWIENHPISFITWYEANQYCRWLADLSGKKYYLPREIEWEYAAKGTEDPEVNICKYSGSDILSEVGWFRRNSKERTQPVGELKPNQFGIYDMSGNVFEWCGDCEIMSTNNMMPLRGGSWANKDSNCTTTSVSLEHKKSKGYQIGFRLALRG